MTIVFERDSIINIHTYPGDMDNAFVPMSLCEIHHVINKVVSGCSSLDCIWGPDHDPPAE